MIHIKQFGLRRSSTNYIRALIEKNYKNINTLVHTVEGKHEKPIELNEENYTKWLAEGIAGKGPEMNPIVGQPNFKDIKYLLSIKNPYSWMISYYKHFNRGDEPAGNAPINFDPTDKEDHTALKQMIERYNDFGNAFIQFKVAHPNNCYISKYEALLEDRDGELRKIQNLFGLQKAFEDISNESAYIGPGYYKWGTFDTSFYTNEEYMNFFNGEQLKIIRENIDYEMMEYFGYQIK